MIKTFTLWLDPEYSQMSYWLYRSNERNTYNGRPTVDGVYIWRREIGEAPPPNMKLTLEWEDNNDESAT